MRFKNSKSVIILLVLLMFCACLDSGNGGNPSKPNSTAASYGTFRIQLIPENKSMNDPAYTSVLGAMYDGPSPPNIIFQEVKSSGVCKLMKAVTPFCSQNCGLGYKCIADDSCMAEPKAIEVGKVTLTGLKYDNKLTPVVMEPLKGNYQMVGVTLDYPPWAEGDTITLAAAGSAAAAAFTLKARGITPLEVLNNEIVLEDGKPITLQWKPPTVHGVSTISVQINISYHGGTKAEIQCECEDNGSLTIPGSMLNDLKSYGIAGYPRVDITRKSVGYDEISKAKVIIECMVTRILTIPGVVSCDRNEDCPNQNCVDRRCQ
jgi:hypothetical protein